MVLFWLGFRKLLEMAKWHYVESKLVIPAHLFIVPNARVLSGYLSPRTVGELGIVETLAPYCDI